MGNPRAGWEIYITICIQVVSKCYKDDGVVDGVHPKPEERVWQNSTLPPRRFLLGAPSKTGWSDSWAVEERGELMHIKERGERENTMAMII